MKHTMLFKNKLEFINSEIMTHSDSIFYVWKRRNMLVISRIAWTLFSQIDQSTVYVDNT